MVQIDKLAKESMAKSKEECRRKGATLFKETKKFQIENLCITSYLSEPSLSLSLAEGIILSNYQFLTYKSDKTKSYLKKLTIEDARIKAAEFTELNEVLTGVYFARTLVNEPVITLTAERLSQEIKKLGKAANFSVKVLDKKEIMKEKMGGLLAVNSGSQLPPTFTILEHKPKNAKNKKRYVLVGKGVVYDTGGLSLKPTAGSMDSMKSDMAGAAAVVGAIYAIAKNNLPIHVVGLIPATDNRPGEIAYTPGDVITLRGGITVEVLNTDAEGRLVLADALVKASEEKPDYIVDLATLTGAQVMGMGLRTAGIMGNNDEFRSFVHNSAEATGEDMWPMPLPEFLRAEINSPVADLANIGSGKGAGMQLAAVFLREFVPAEIPWAHLDIAGPAYNQGSAYGYNVVGSTGFGIRTLVEVAKRVSVS